jgi:protein gp37
MAGRLKAMGQAKYQRDGDPRTSGPGFGVTTHPDTLNEPLRWRKPRRVFVCSMSDLFHPQVGEDFIAAVFGVMALASQHQFQVLTKRPARMGELLSRDDFLQLAAEHVEITAGQHGWDDVMAARWPLPNVWVGVSAEDQQRADQRIPYLLDTPAVVRFVSAEPLLGPVNLSAVPIAQLDWLIVGGESGPGARPMHPQWARDLRDQAISAGVAFFFKQWGASGGHGGRELDGDTWNQWPDTAEVPV